MTASSIPRRVSAESALPALIAAACVVIVLALQQVLNLMASIMITWSQATDPGELLRSLVLGLVSLTLPFAAGVFVSLWLLITPRTTSELPVLLLSAVVAAAIGGVFATVASGIARLLSGLSFSGPLFGNRFPVSFDPYGGLYELGYVLHAGFSLFVTGLPVVALVVVLQQFVLRRA